LTTEYRIGTQGWSYPDWIGTFYPPGSKQEHYLPFYAEVFDLPVHYEDGASAVFRFGPGGQPPAQQQSQSDKRKSEESPHRNARVRTQVTKVCVRAGPFGGPVQHS